MTDPVATPIIPASNRRPTLALAARSAVVQSVSADVHIVGDRVPDLRLREPNRKAAKTVASALRTPAP